MTLVMSITEISGEGRTNCGLRRLRTGSVEGKVSLIRPICEQEEDDVREKEHEELTGSPRLATVDDTNTTINIP